MQNFPQPMSEDMIFVKKVRDGFAYEEFFCYKNHYPSLGKENFVLFADG